MTTFRAVPATDEVFGLAEGPLWDAPRSRVLWVDLNAGRVHSGALLDGRVAPAAMLTFPGTVGAVVSSADGALLVAGARGLHTVAVDGAVGPGPQIIPTTTASRLNDGRCDPAGRFLVGSLALDDRVGGEVLVRVEHDGAITVIDDDLGMSNGLGFSPDGRLLYSIDTTAGVVWIRSYEPTTGACGDRREFVRIDDANPDGLCVDADGGLWIAVWGAGQVRHFDASGTLVDIIEVAAPNTTSVAFAGPDLDTLLITTASESLTVEQRRDHPDSGRLFTCHVGVRGLPVHPWVTP